MLWHLRLNENGIFFGVYSERQKYGVGGIYLTAKLCGLLPHRYCMQIRNGKNLARFYGPKREKFLGALKSMMEAGVVCSLHSDAPSGPVGFEMIDGAVNRYDLRQGYQCDMSQAVTVLQAIRCCTYNAAYQSYEEKIKGSIEVGKLADLIICDRDILAMDTHELHNVKVDLTMIDGKVEYQRV